MLLILTDRLVLSCVNVVLCISSVLVLCISSVMYLVICGGVMLTGQCPRRARLLGWCARGGAQLGDSFNYLVNYSSLLVHPL